MSGLMTPLIFFSIAVITVFLRLHSLGEPLEHDLAIYGYFAHYMLGGELLYTELWDHKPPGIFLAYMAAELLWGYDASAITYTGIVFTVISLAFLFLFLKEIAGVNTALLGSAIWALASNALSLEANQPNAELFLNAFTLMALWSLAKHREGEWRFLFLCGAFFAVASTFKTVAIFPFAAVCLYLVLQVSKTGPPPPRARLKEGAGKLAVILLPCVLVWAGVFSYFALAGRFGDFWGAVFEYNRGYAGNIALNVWNYFTDPRLLFHLAQKDIWPLPLLSLVWVFVGRKEYGPLRRSFFILFLAGCMVAVASPGKYFYHYYQLLLPPFVVMSALFFRDMVEHIQAKKNARLAMALSSIIVLYTSGHLFYSQGTYLRMTPTEISAKKYGPKPALAYEVGSFIKGVSSPCDTVFEWGTGAGIYYYSQRKSAVNTTSLYALFEGRVPKKGDPRLKRLYADVTAAPPAVFVWDGSSGELRGSVFEEFISERYDRIGEYPPFFVYERRHGESSGGDGGC
ncbi:MAG: glycosyltransferase family 39 protein [Thermodesulfobacteriota bacterium]